MLSLKSTLIVSASTALVLGVITYFVVFGGPQDIQPAKNASSSTGTPAFTFPSSTTPGTIAGTDETTSGTVASNMPTSFQSTFASTSVAWNEGQPTFAIKGGTLQNNQLALAVTVQTGNIPQCVPINLRIVSDEQGDMQAPVSPSSQNFPLGQNGDCEGTANTSYDQSLIFNIGGLNAPYIFTTGGTSNIYFEIIPMSDGSLELSIPQQSG